MTKEIVPQLARECYTIDSDDAENDDASSSASSLGSLEILPPRNRTKNENGKNEAKLSQSAPLCFESSKENYSRKLQPTKVKTRVVTNLSSKATASRLNLDFSSEEDSDDENLKQAIPTSMTNQTSRKRSLGSTSKMDIAMTVTEKRAQQQEERARKKRQTEERKRQEKAARQSQREQEKKERAQKKEEEKEAKRKQSKLNAQVAGKFSHDEVVLLMDTSIYHNSEYDLVNVLGEDFKIKEYPSALNSSHNALQWIRKEYIAGGAESALECLQERKNDEFVHIAYLAFLLEPDDYIPLIQRMDHDVDDDFPEMAKWLNSIKQRWKMIWDTTEEPRIILLLRNVSEELDRRWIEHNRRKSQSNAVTPPTEWEFQDSIQWLLVQFQVDCIQCNTVEDIQASIHKLTRGLAEAPYAKQVTELECIRKIKSGLSVGDDPFSKATDVWLRQLQMIPRVSETRARNLVQHYPTLQSLWKAYKRSGDEEYNRNLLTQCLDNKSSQALLSSSIYTVITSTNPNEIL